MGEKQIFQPLTREDKVTVVLYRTGIVLSTIVIATLAYFVTAVSARPGTADLVQSGDILGYALYITVGTSVFFIHLYMGSFKKFLMNLYYLSLACLVVLLYVGKGSVAAGLMHASAGPLLLLPLSGCLGFITAKEAFCFRLFEGYLLAMIMPVYLLLLSLGALTGRGAAAGLVLIALLLVLFTLRKVFMPVAWDIGDKSAYR